MQGLLQGFLKWGAAALFVLCGILAPTAAKAEEQYLIVPLAVLKQVEPEKPLLQQGNWFRWGMTLSARMDSPGGQAYIARNIQGKFGRPVLDGKNTLSNRFANDLAEMQDDAIYLVARIDG